MVLEQYHNVCVLLPILKRKMDHLMGGIQWVVVVMVVVVVVVVTISRAIYEKHIFVTRETILPL